MTRPEDMNTIDADGKAFNGNYKVVWMAIGLVVLFIISFFLVSFGVL